MLNSPAALFKIEISRMTRPGSDEGVIILIATLESSISAPLEDINLSKYFKFDVKSVNCENFYKIWLLKINL